MVQIDGMTAFLAAYDLAERTESNEAEHHGATKGRSDVMSVCSELNTTQTLINKRVEIPVVSEKDTRHGVNSVHVCR